MYWKWFELNRALRTGAMLEFFSLIYALLIWFHYFKVPNVSSNVGLASNGWMLSSPIIVWAMRTTVSCRRLYAIVKLKPDVHTCKHFYSHHLVCCLWELSRATDVFVSQNDMTIVFYSHCAFLMMYALTTKKWDLFVPYIAPQLEAPQIKFMHEWIHEKNIY